jgi:glycerophosphoryl diester phosphodiesterase
MPMNEFMTIAHRGASSYAPENTISAFQKALELGVGHVELDVHLSRDGQVVVIHDELLDRTTNGSGPVASHAWEQLQSLDAGAWFGPEFAGAGIPTLEQVLERFQEQFHFHIEIKGETDNLAQRTIDLVRRYGLEDKVTITSFREEPLRETREYAPALLTGWLVPEATEGVVSQARELGLSSLCPRADTVTPELVERLHRRGFLVRAWGVADEELMRRMVDAGADGMTVNFPDKLLEYLASRGRARR